MGLKDWRARRSLRDPVRGQFEVTGRYFAHPNSSSFREMLTGVVTGPGIVATAGEHLGDTSGRWVGHDVLPALIDRADPVNFIVLWDEVPKPDFRAQARAHAEQAADAARAATTGPADPAQPQAHGTDGTDGTGGSPPAWAAELIADLARQGVLPADTAAAAPGPVTVQLPDQIVELTVGGISASDAAHLIRTGESATAVLTRVTEVAVPQQALPGPTASLCDLTLRVTRSSGTNYEATTRLGFRDAQRRAEIAVIGTVLPVRVDPDDATRVVVDTTAYDERHPNLRKSP